jgi:CubicO group peptidase (beta-lactamase class C family)
MQPLVAYAEIDQYVAQQMRQLHLPAAALAIVEDGRIVHTRGFGRLHGDGVPTAPTAQTPFFIGSLTKSFTALAVMQLAEGGKIELDAPVTRYLPWFAVADPRAGPQITVRHLLHQTSGLPPIAGETPLADFDQSPGATERQARALGTCPLAHRPGAAFTYSNMNYNLLGLVVAAVSGEPYADYLQRHICAPLEMRHTYVDKTAAARNGLAGGHQLWFWQPRAADLPVPRGSLPSGQLISCAEDMAHYLMALLNGGRYGEARILSPEGCEQLRQGAVPFRQWGLALGDYGMGWFAGTVGATQVAWHTGNVPDYSAYMALLPQRHCGAVLLANAGHHMMVPVCGELGAGLAARLAGEEIRPGPVRLVRVLPWLMRSLLLVPLVQAAEVGATARALRTWRLNPAARPPAGSKWGSKWGRHFLLPLLLHLALAANLLPVLGRRRGYLALFLPDYTAIARVCGSFALAWGMLRSGLVLWAWRARQGPVPQGAQQGAQRGAQQGHQGGRQPAEQGRKQTERKGAGVTALKERPV